MTVEEPIIRIVKRWAHGGAYVSVPSDLAGQKVIVEKKKEVRQ